MPNTLDYMGTGVRPAEPSLDSRIRFRWLRRCVTAILVILFSLVYWSCIGNTRLRVRMHHGVILPSSADVLRCSGSTLPVIDFGDGHSKAEFTIDATDLPRFLSQFTQVNEYLPNYHSLPGTATMPSFPPLPKPAPLPGPLTPSGTIGGRSPTGRDRFYLEWETKGKKVHITLETDWS